MKRLLIAAVVFCGCELPEVEMSEPATVEQPQLSLMERMAEAHERPKPWERERIAITAADHGDKWPLTVDECEVEVVNGFCLVLHADGREFALNGTAQTWLGLPKLDADLWRDNNDPLGGPKVNIQPLFDAGQSLASWEG